MRISHFVPSVGLSDNIEHIPAIQGKGTKLASGVSQLDFFNKLTSDKKEDEPRRFSFGEVTLVADTLSTAQTLASNRLDGFRLVEIYNHKAFQSFHLLFVMTPSMVALHFPLLHCVPGISVVAIGQDT